jgi:hypothetical protein
MNKEPTLALYETLRPAIDSLPTSDRLAVLTAMPLGSRGIAPLDLGIVETLPRAISSRTGRTCEVDEFDGAPRVVNIAAYDGIAITIPVSDAPRPTPLAGWQEALRSTLEALLLDLPVGAPILVAVPLVRSGSAPHTLRARIDERHHSRFTSEVAGILSDVGRGELFVLPVELDSTIRTITTLGAPDRVAGAIADRLAPRLLQARHNSLARQMRLSA